MTVPEKALYLEGVVLIDIRVAILQCIIQHTKVNAPSSFEPQVGGSQGNCIGVS